MSYDFIQNPIMPGNIQTTYNGLTEEQKQEKYNQYQNFQSQYQQSQNIEIEKPSVNTGGFNFTVIPDDSEVDTNSPLVLQSPDTTEVTTRRRGRPKKQEVSEVDSSEIVRAEGTVEDVSTIYSYASTTMLLNNTLEQLDTVASELKEEFDQVRLSRTLKGKYNYIVGLGNSLSQILSTKANVIKEINSAITKSNELDYRKEKDRKAAENGMEDDKYIMDLYNSFIKNPFNNQDNSTMLGPNSLQTTVNGSAIVRTPLAGSEQPVVADAGYLNYLSNISPEQNMMFHEQNPNVKTVVVFDASTGNKMFQVMDISTGQVIPNVPVLDNRFMEDTTIDLKNKIAKNNNLHETYPVVVINDNIMKEY